jgi:hypothetical protein
MDYSAKPSGRPRSFHQSQSHGNLQSRHHASSRASSEINAYSQSYSNQYSQSPSHMRHDNSHSSHRVPYDNHAGPQSMAPSHPSYSSSSAKDQPAFRTPVDSIMPPGEARSSRDQRSYYSDYEVPRRRHAPSHTSSCSHHHPASQRSQVCFTPAPLSLLLFSHTFHFYTFAIISRFSPLTPRIPTKAKVKTGQGRSPHYTGVSHGTLLPAHAQYSTHCISFGCVHMSTRSPSVESCT